MRELAQIIQKEMSASELGMVTVCEVNVTKDLAQAKVFVSLIQDEPEQVKETMKALNDNAGFLRSLLAKKIKLRTTPKLMFQYDDSLARGNRISKLIDDSIARENNVDDGED